MTALEIRNRPHLREPILVVAFFGWNDAAEAATDAIKFLRGQSRTEAFASIDADEFFVFTEHRPTVKWVDGGSRQILWPTTDFTTLALPDTPHDMILGIGTEPDLRWKQYTALIAEMAREFQVHEVVTLGALLADVAHTRQTPISGGASDPDRAASLGFTASRYEGPTGVVGAVSDMCRREAIPSLSLWASVPHYVTSRHNPAATKALLERLDDVYKLGLDYSRLDGPIERYRRGVSEALKDKPEVLDYVRTLEAQTDEQEQPLRTPLESNEILEEVNRLLRGSDDEPS